jgi:hypothetical protein
MRDEFNARISSLEARVETVIRILEKWQLSYGEKSI